MLTEVIVTFEDSFPKKIHIQALKKISKYIFKSLHQSHVVKFFRDGKIYATLSHYPLLLLFLTSAGSSPPTPKGEKVAAALAVSCSVPAQGHNTLEFCLSWDMPKMTFGSREREHIRYVALLKDKQDRDHCYIVITRKHARHELIRFMTDRAHKCETSF